MANIVLLAVNRRLWHDVKRNDPRGHSSGTITLSNESLDRLSDSDFGVSTNPETETHTTIVRCSDSCRSQGHSANHDGNELSTICTAEEGQNVCWQFTLGNKKQKVCICPSTFEIWLNGIPIENVKVDMICSPEKAQTKMEKGLIKFEFPLPWTNGSFIAVISARFLSPIHIRGVVNPHSPIFTTQLTHLTTSLGLRIGRWHLHCARVYDVPGWPTPPPHRTVNL
ncbi:unnamed protein product [Calicophoron daubneyi]|uniref:Uncharacterized protein n=1 Tax=Calicophoron daubneyi TaxID=300641 RepID=A0AAV2TR15_CALDB